LVLAALLGATPLAAAAQDDGPLDIVFTMHSTPGNVFWQAVKRGMDDACARIEANCQMLFVQVDGSVQEQVANMEAALAREIDALITSIVDNTAFDDVIQRARDAGVVVIAANVDDIEGAAGNARQAFIGQDVFLAGYSLAQTQWANMPAEGPIHVLVGVNGPGQNWSEQRALGITNFLDEMIAAHPERQITYERIDAGLDLAVVGDRVGAYLGANPHTTAYFDTGFWHAAVARVLAERGVPPGQVLLGGFDLVPEVLDQMKAGYIQVQVDQQPYMQGFMSVMMAYLSETVDLAPADIDTGQAIVTPDMVDAIMALSAQGLR
jgi:simple sugar transport system substrate-binding protein